MRERTHPFNTARIVRRALANSELIVQHNSHLVQALSRFDFSSGTGLLYPGDQAIPLDTLTAKERPKQLVVLDGTWHHAKTLLRDLPQLQTLPRYSFVATQPSRYRIRREPSVACLSTLEATVMALQTLEPETLGFDLLLSAFDRMIDGQLMLPMPDYGARRKNPNSLSCTGVPRIIRDHLQNVVVVYGETLPGFRGDLLPLDDTEAPTDNQQPCYWIAERMVSGERFESAIQPGMQLSSSFLRHLGLPESVFGNAPNLEQVAESWRLYLRKDDTLAYYYSNIPKLLKKLDCNGLPMIHLKSIRRMAKKNKPMEQVLSDLGIQIPNNGHANRARRRLDTTMALVQYLNDCGSRCAEVPAGPAGAWNSPGRGDRA